MGSLRYPAYFLLAALTPGCARSCPDETAKCSALPLAAAKPAPDIVSNRQYYWITPSSPYTLTDVFDFLGEDPPKVGACSQIAGDAWKDRTKTAASAHNRLSQKDRVDSPDSDWFEGAEKVDSTFTTIVTNEQAFAASTKASFSKTLTADVGAALSARGADFVIAAPRRRISTTAMARACMRDSFCALHDRDFPKPKAAIVTSILYGSMVRLTMSTSSLGVKAKTDIADTLSVAASFSTQSLTMAGGVIGGFSVDSAKLQSAIAAKNYDVPEIIEDAKSLRFLDITSQFDRVTSEYGVIAIAVEESACP
jgi:hypothetical protein